MDEIEKRNLIKELNQLNKRLLDYKKRQERHVKIKFTEGQMKKLDELRTRTRQSFRQLKDIISEYGGNASIKIVGIKYNAFEYSLRPQSVHIIPELFTALNMAINTVNTTIKRIEVLPAESIKLRDTVASKTITEQQKEPTYLLDITKLHPRIVEVSKSLFETGFYAQAIFEAFKAVNNFVKEKSGLSPIEIRRITDKQLMAKVFDENDPIIKLNELLTDTDISEQEGFKFLFMGATAGIRNPKAHDFIEMKDPHKTLEYLAFASLLLKKISFWKVD